MFSKTIFYRTHSKRVLYQIGHMWMFSIGSNWIVPETGAYSFLVVCDGGSGGDSYPSGWGYGGGGGGSPSVNSVGGWTNLTIPSTPMTVTSTRIQLGSSTYYVSGVQLNCSALGLTTNFQGGARGESPVDELLGGAPNGGGRNQDGSSGSALDLTLVNSRFMNRFSAGVAGEGGVRNGLFGGGGGGSAGLFLLPGLGFPSGLSPSAPAENGAGGAYGGKAGTGFGSGGGGSQGDYGGESRGGSGGYGGIFVMKTGN